MLKPGKYLCKVLAPCNGWFGEAGKANTPFIRIPLQIIEPGDCEGEETTFQGWLTHKALDRTIKNLAEVFGWDGDLEALASQLDIGPFVGKECSITCETEEYEGKKRTVIKWLNRPGAVGKTLNPESSMALAKKFGARSKAAAANKDEIKAQAPMEPGADLDLADDPIPF